MSNVDLTNIHYAAITDLAPHIAKGALSPVALTEHMLARIEAIDPTLKSYATVMADSARAQARQAESDIAAGNYRGPLHGIPVAVKDLCFTAGTRTMAGMALRRTFVPDADAAVVQRLKAAGAVLLGKLNLTEGAMAGYNPELDIPVNPWNPDFWAGVSSSGSGVAVAAGLCFAALGTDTGGSIRFPSMANGIAGLKPSFGRLSHAGTFHLSPSLDHIGPMARSVADAGLLYDALAGFDSDDPNSLAEDVELIGDEPDLDPSLLRIGIDPAFNAHNVDHGLVIAIDRAVAELKTQGASVVNINLPINPDMITEAWFLISAYEAVQAHADTFPAQADGYGPYFREFLTLGASITTEQYRQASVVRDNFNDAFNRLWEEIDILIAPAGGVTVAVDRSTMYQGIAALQAVSEQVHLEHTAPANFAGIPALTLPCGRAEDGAPYALQMMGARLNDRLVIQAGQLYQSLTQWHCQHPQL